MKLIDILEDIARDYANTMSWDKAKEILIQGEATVRNFIDQEIKR